MAQDTEKLQFQEQTISFSDFLKVDIRVGTIIAVEVFLEAKKAAYKITIDLGEGLGIKKSSAQITDHYIPEELIGTQVLCVVNFPPKQIGPYISQVLTLGVPCHEGKVVLVQPTKKVPNGSRLY